LSTGKLSDLMGRKFVMILSTCLFAAGLGVTSVLRSFPSESYLAYIAAGLFGLGDAGLNNLVGASVNDLFPEKQRGAWVVVNVAQNISSAVGFFYSPFLPLVTQGTTVGTIWQIPINGALLALACFTFMWIDFRAAPKTTLK
jgi:MFS family permease